MYGVETILGHKNTDVALVQYDVTQSSNTQGLYRIADKSGKELQYLHLVVVPTRGHFFRREDLESTCVSHSCQRSAAV